MNLTFIDNFVRVSSMHRNPWEADGTAHQEWSPHRSSMDADSVMSKNSLGGASYSSSNTNSRESQSLTDQNAHDDNNGSQSHETVKKEKSVNKRALSITGIIMGGLIVVSAGITTAIESLSFDHQVEELNLVGMTEQEALGALEEHDSTENVETALDEPNTDSDYSPELDYVVSAYDVDGNDVELELSYQAADEIMSQEDDLLELSLPELQRELSAYNQGSDYSIYTENNNDVYVESNWSVIDMEIDEAEERAVFVLGNHFLDGAQETTEDVADNLSDSWDEVWGN